MTGLLPGRSSRRKEGPGGLVLAAVLALASLPEPARAQASAHERTSVRPVLPWELSLDFDASISAANEAASCLCARFDLAVEALLGSRLSLRASLPLDARLGAEAEACAPVAVAAGDPALALSWTETLEAWRCSFEAGSSLPLGPLEPLAAAGLGLRPRRGGPRLSAAVGVQRCLDPLVLALRLGNETELGSLASGKGVVRPFCLELGLSLTEILSRNASLSISLAQELEGPRLVEGRLLAGGWRCGLAFSICLFLAFDAAGLRVGCAGIPPASLAIGFSRWVRPRDK